MRASPETPPPQLTHPVSPSPCKKITWKRAGDGEEGSHHPAIALCPPVSGHPPPSLPRTWGRGVLREQPPASWLQGCSPPSPPPPSSPHPLQSAPQTAWGLRGVGEDPYRSCFPLSSRHSGSVGEQGHRHGVTTHTLQGSTAGACANTGQWSRARPGRGEHPDPAAEPHTRAMSPSIPLGSISWAQREGRPHSPGAEWGGSVPSFQGRTAEAATLAALGLAPHTA